MRPLSSRRDPDPAHSIEYPVDLPAPPATPSLALLRAVTVDPSDFAFALVLPAVVFGFSFTVEGITSLDGFFKAGTSILDCSVDPPDCADSWDRFGSLSDSDILWFGAPLLPPQSSSMSTGAFGCHTIVNETMTAIMMWRRMLATAAVVRIFLSC